MTIIETVNKIKNVALAALLSLVIGVGIGYWVMPTKTITQTVEKIVESKVNTKDNTVTVIDVKRPDGTTETTTIKKDVTTDTTTKEKDKVTNNTTVAPAAGTAYRPNYSVAAFAQLDPKQPGKPSYDFSIGYRVLGNAWVDGMFLSKDKEVAVGVRIDF